MKKEGFRSLNNSSQAKVNLMLLAGSVFIFVIMAFFVNAITITQNSPTNPAINSSRSVNFTFTVVWNGDSPNEAVGNCSIWTNLTGTWTQTVVNSSNGSSSKIYNSSATLSLINTTLSNDGANFSWAVQCTNGTSAGGLGGSNFSINRTLTVDTAAPSLFMDTPNSGVLLGNTNSYNITSYATATFYVNVSDNTTSTVWMVLNKNATVAYAPAPISDGENETVNRTMSYNGTDNGAGNKRYYFNLSGLLNFNSTFTSPGPHSVVFCANDTFNRITCSNRSDYIIMGMNITQMENIFSKMQQGGTGVAFGGLNITFGNGTELPDDTFMNPITGVSYGGITMKNFTFIINISNNFKIHIVGGRIDADQFANTSNTRANSTPTPEVRKQVGSGFSPTMLWADIASFIPSEVSYEYGMLQIGGTGYSKRMFCNGTSMADPQCHQISQCNSTVFDIYNNTLAIPANDGCWLEALSTTSPVINGVNLSVQYSGYTFLFVDHFSGGLGGEDRSQINVTFNGTLRNDYNTTIALNDINFTLEDLNSTGINLTMNASINVSIFQGATKLTTFNYTEPNGTTSLTCRSIDGNESRGNQNTTIVSCNVTYAFSNGTFIINVTARDTSNNSNPVNASTGSITIIVDQIAPVNYNSSAFPNFALYYNFTDILVNNTGSAYNGTNGTQLGLGNGVSTAQGRIIYAISNYTDNLTQVFQGALQFYNNTNSQWTTINATPGVYQAFRNGSWINLSYGIPTGHGYFENANVSFRLIVNDTVGNFNNTAKNFTIQINDTTKPTLTVTIGSALDVNGTNVSTTTPTIVWNITETSDLRYIALQVDTSTSIPCNKKANYTLEDGLTKDQNRNGTLTISSSGACPLSNGTHTIRLTTEDVWSNSELYIHNFTVSTGVNPIIVVTALQNGLSAINNSNLTPYTGINFTAYSTATGATIKNMTWTSSCNSAGEILVGIQVINDSFIWPFNASDCKNTEANRTVTVTVSDFSGNSVTNMFQFAVDDLGPSVATSLKNGDSFTDLAFINISALDRMNEIHSIVYYLDGNNNLANNFTLFNGSAQLATQGINTSIINKSINFTAGTHTIKFTVNDTRGKQGNTSIITFTQTGPVDFGLVNTSINSYIASVYNTNITNVSIRIKTADGYEQVNSTNETSGRTFEILYNINNTLNISLTEINGSAASWNKINFTPIVNDSTTRSHTINNWTNTVLTQVVFNNTLEEFILNNNSYYGVVVFLFNDSNRTPSGPEFWWFPNEGNLSATGRTNISKCTSAFTAATPTPCWNYTSGGRTIVQVPHFSVVVVSNDSLAPTINLTTPGGTALSGNQSVSSFVPNITVSEDAKSCVYQLNSSSPSNLTMTKSGAICLGGTEHFKNLATAIGFNVTFWVTDNNNNINQYIWQFNVSDTTPPNNGVISSSPGTTTATVTVTGANESVNVTVNYGTTNTSLGSSATNTAFNTTESVSITGLTASTTYHYNVTVCDFNGNCKTNSTVFSFATSAASTSTTSTTSSSSSSGGGSATTAAATTTVAVAASVSRQWDTLAAGTSGVLAVKNDQIAVTGVTIDVANTVTSPSLTVASLSSNPLSEAAATKVYQYLQLSKLNIADSDASKIMITFKVPKSWLTSNGVAESGVVLWRYSSSTWNRLETKLTSSDGSYAAYEAITPGFSVFAVGNKEGGASAFAIIDMIRDFYAGASRLTAFDIIDQIRAFYGG